MTTTTPTLWTPERVKAELPTVSVYARRSKKTYTGYVHGRKREFALIWFDGYDGQVTMEVAWKTIAFALNQGKPVQF